LITIIQYTAWNAHLKDALENRLLDLVCAGKVNLETAQHQIASNSIKAHKKYIAKSPPALQVGEPQSCPEPATAEEL